MILQLVAVAVIAGSALALPQSAEIYATPKVSDSILSCEMTVTMAMFGFFLVSVSVNR